MSKELKKVIFRWVVAVLGLGYALLRLSSLEGNMFSVLPELLLVLVILVVVGLICGLPLAGWMGERFAQFFLPQRRIVTPPDYIYDSPRLSVQQGERAKAVGQYQQIIDNYPSEWKAYSEMYPLLNAEGKKALLVEAEEALSARAWQDLQKELGVVVESSSGS